MMLEVVYNVKNNPDSAEMKQEKDKTTVLRNLISKTFGANNTPLSIGLTDIRNIPTNGRWWVLGAQYKPVKRDVAQEKNCWGWSEGAEGSRETSYEYKCAKVGVEQESHI